MARGKQTFNFMALVKCPVNDGRATWANNTSTGLKCTKCSGTGHDKVRG